MWPMCCSPNALPPDLLLQAGSAFSPEDAAVLEAALMVLNSAAASSLTLLSLPPVLSPAFGTSEVGAGPELAHKLTTSLHGT